MYTWIGRFDWLTDPPFLSIRWISRQSLKSQNVNIKGKNFLFYMVINQNFGLSENRQKVAKFWAILGKKLLPKASKKCQNGDKSPHLATLDSRIISKNKRKEEQMLQEQSRYSFLSKIKFYLDPNCFYLLLCLPFDFCLCIRHWFWNFWYFLWKNPHISNRGRLLFEPI